MGQLAMGTMQPTDTDGNRRTTTVRGKGLQRKRTRSKALHPLIVIGTSCLAAHVHCKALPKGSP